MLGMELEDISSGDLEKKWIWWCGIMMMEGFLQNVVEERKVSHKVMAVVMAFGKGVHRLICRYVLISWKSLAEKQFFMTS